jgi:hypothetical protein
MRFLGDDPGRCELKISQKNNGSVNLLGKILAIGRILASKIKRV